MYCESVKGATTCIVVNRCIWSAELSRFSALQRALSTAVGEYIRAGGEPADQMIRSLIDCEYDYINYDHPDFIGGSSAVAAVLAAKKMRGSQKADGGKDKPENAAEQGARNQRAVAEAHPPPTIIRNARGPRVETVNNNPMVGLKVCLSFVFPLPTAACVPGWHGFCGAACLTAQAVM